MVPNDDRGTTSEENYKSVWCCGANGPKSPPKERLINGGLSCVGYLATILRCKTVATILAAGRVKGQLQNY